MADIGKLIAVVRIRGRVNVSSDIEETMKRLRLDRVNSCSILKLTDSYKGMIKKCQNHVAYGEIDEETLSKLLAKHLPELNAKDVMKNAGGIKERMPFRLHPPRHGFRPTRRSFVQGGTLGYMGKEINSLIKRMV